MEDAAREVWERSEEHADLEKELEVWKTRAGHAEELALRAEKGFKVSKELWEKECAMSKELGAECQKLRNENTDLRLAEARRLRLSSRPKRAWGVQTDPPPPVSARCVQTDLVVVESAAPRSYASVAAQSEPVGVCDSGSGGGPAPPSGSSGPPPVGARAVVVHGVSCRRSMAEILWQARQVWTGGMARVVAVRWLVGIDRRRGKAASSVVVYLSGVVSVRSRVVRFGGRWCPVDRYEFGRRGGP